MSTLTTKHNTFV